MTGFGAGTWGRFAARASPAARGTIRSRRGSSRSGKRRSKLWPMHELPYEEPTTQGAGDSRRLARWAAAWTLAAFGSMGLVSLVGFGDAMRWDSENVVAEVAAVGYTLGGAISGLSFPLAVAAAGVWLATGRVVVWVLASVPMAVVAGQLFVNVRFFAEYGANGIHLMWLLVGAGYVLLGLLFFTRTFRRAVNAPRTARA